MKIKFMMFKKIKLTKEIEITKYELENILNDNVEYFIEIFINLTKVNTGLLKKVYEKSKQLYSPYTTNISRLEQLDELALLQNGRLEKVHKISEKLKWNSDLSKAEFEMYMDFWKVEGRIDEILDEREYKET